MTKTPTMKAVTEAVEYPWSITIPPAFTTLLERINVEHTNIPYGVMARFETKTKLMSFLREMKKSKDSRSDVILDGIYRSI